MILAQMPYPGALTRGFQLRSEACQSISYAEQMARLSPESTTAADLRQFFLDCAKLLEASIPAKKATKKETA